MHFFTKATYPIALKDILVLVSCLNFLQLFLVNWNQCYEKLKFREKIMFLNNQFILFFDEEKIVFK